MDGSHNHGRDPADGYTNTGKSYALSGKIMLTAIIVLFFVVVLMFSLHLYARWYLLQARRRQLQNRRRASRRGHIVFYIDPSATEAHRGLDADVLKSLPVFAFSSQSHPDPNLECAVCLSQFEEEEPGRTLPKCNHSFHIECIDMWFHSHSTCPLCRTPVDGPVDPGHVALNITDPRASESGTGTASELCSSCLHGEDGREPPPPPPSSLRKLSIEVPGRSGQAVDGEGSQSLRSPMSRMLSLRRILSRESRQSPVPSPRNPGSYRPVRESEAERVSGDEVNELYESENSS